MVVNKKIKKIFFAPIWGLRIYKLIRTATKYRKKKIELNAMVRNQIISKYAAKYLKLQNVQVSVKGLENVPSKGPVFLIPNHQDNLDSLVILKSLIPQEKEDTIKITTFLAKKSLQKSKIVRSSLTLLDSFFIDRNNPRYSLLEIDEFSKFVKENKTYGVIFAEGTRTKNGELGEFKAGAFKMAKKYYIPILPVTINSTYNAARNKKGIAEVEIIFHNLIKSSSFSTQTNEAIAERVKNIIASKYSPFLIENNVKKNKN